jgi:hypothetical protein
MSGRIGWGRHREQGAPGTIWTNWTVLPKKTLAQAAASTNTDGRVQIVAVDNLGNVWQSTPSAGGSTLYNPWTQIPGLQLRP